MIAVSGFSLFFLLHWSYMKETPVALQHYFKISWEKSFLSF